MLAMIISNIIKFFVPLGLFIWALFMPRIAGYIYVAIYGLFEGYLFLIDKTKVKPDPSKWATEEIEIIKKYYLALRFPFGAKDMSVYLNGFRWSGILWIVLFLVNQMWIAAVFVLISFFITSSISVRLDPFFFLGQAVASGQMQFARELSLLQRVAEKLNKKIEAKGQNIKDVYEKYIDKNDLSGSLSKLNKLLKNDTEDRLELLDAKAEVLNLMGRSNEAVEIYELILKENKNYTNAYIALATIYQSKEIKDEEKYSQKIINLYKTLEGIDADKVSYYVLAGALKDNGDFEEALQYYKKAIKQEKDDNYFLENIYTDMAKIFTEQERFTEALKAYDDAKQCSITEYGDDRHCSEIYAFKRDIYERIKDWQSVKEMDKKFAAAEKAYNKNKESSQKEHHGERFEKIYGNLEKLGERERKTSDDLSKLMLLTIEDKYKDQEISYEKLVKIIDDILQEVEYEKEIRAIEKARLINLVSGQVQNGSK